MGRREQFEIQDGPEHASERALLHEVSERGGRIPPDKEAGRRGSLSSVRAGPHDWRPRWSSLRCFLPLQFHLSASLL